MSHLSFKTFEIWSNHLFFFPGVPLFKHISHDARGRLELRGNDCSKVAGCGRRYNVTLSFPCPVFYDFSFIFYGNIRVLCWCCPITKDRIKIGHCSAPTPHKERADNDSGARRGYFYTHDHSDLFFIHILVFGSERSLWPPVPKRLNPPPSHPHILILNAELQADKIHRRSCAPDNTARPMTTLFSAVI